MWVCWLDGWVQMHSFPTYWVKPQFHICKVGMIIV